MASAVLQNRAPASTPVRSRERPASLGGLVMPLASKPYKTDGYRKRQDIIDLTADHDGPHIASQGRPKAFALAKGSNLSSLHYTAATVRATDSKVNAPPASGLLTELSQPRPVRTELQPGRPFKPSLGTSRSPGDHRRSGASASDRLDYLERLQGVMSRVHDAGDIDLEPIEGVRKRKRAAEGPSSDQDSDCDTVDGTSTVSDFAPASPYSPSSPASTLPTEAFKSQERWEVERIVDSFRTGKKRRVVDYEV